MVKASLLSSRPSNNILKYTYLYCLEVAHLAHKTITISDEAYRALKRLKKPNESFTQVILRLARTKRTGQELLAFLKKSDQSPN